MSNLATMISIWVLLKSPTDFLLNFDGPFPIKASRSFNAVILLSWDWAWMRIWKAESATADTSLCSCDPQEDPDFIQMSHISEHCVESHSSPKCWAINFRRQLKKEEKFWNGFLKFFLVQKSIQRIIGIFPRLSARGCVFLVSILVAKQTLTQLDHRSVCLKDWTW